MKNINNVFYILIIIFTIVMPIIPSTLNIKSISLAGDTILYFIILYFLLILIFNKNKRSSLFKDIKTSWKDYINIFMIIWVITMFISAYFAKDKLLAFTESIRLSSYVILFFILKYYITEDKIYKYILKSYMLTSLIIGLFSIYVTFMGIGSFKVSKFGSEIRISSLLENPNNLGMYSVFIIFPIIVLLLKDKNIKNKIIYFILTIMSLVNIIFSYSRNAILGFTFGIIILIVTMGIRYIYLAGVPVLLTYFIPTLTNRVKDISDTSQNLSRIKIWTIAALMFKDHPIFGVGNGNYPKYYLDYANKVAYIKYKFTVLIHPHNAFLKAFCELGILGGLSFIGLIISSFITVFKFIKNQSDNFYSWFYKGIFISLFSMAAMNSIDSFFNTPKVIVYYFITIGICEGIRVRQNSMIYK